MDLKLNDKWRISSNNQHQYILQSFAGSYDNEGNEARINVGYYGNLKQLVNGLLEHEVKTSGIDDLQALSVQLDELVDKIVKTIETHGKQPTEPIDLF